MIAIDHVGLMARDVDASARFLAELLELPAALPGGPEGENRRLHIAGPSWIFYFPAEDVPGQHVAFRVDEQTFARVVHRLRHRGITFGNDPEDTTNMQTSDFLGGHGRVFFQDPNGHLFEVMA